MRKRAAIPKVPSPGEGMRGVDGHIGYLLRQAAASHRLRMERALADLGVTPPQFVVMTMINAYPGASSADLARLAFLTPQTLSVIIANLERDGAIAREAHASHGRILQVALTDKGRKLLARCRKRAHEIEQRLNSELSGEQERVVRAWLVKAAMMEDAPA